MVLGSGGARGYAHIGVIDELERRGLRVVSVAGSSMGALVGGLYAAGRLDEFRHWAIDQRSVDVLRMLDLSFDSVGLIRGDKVFAMLNEMVGRRTIESLELPFTAVATDLTRLKEIWFQEGDLLEAIRASISIPSLFTPVVRNGRVLVDGGLLNPIPIAPTVSAHADLIVAVNLNAAAQTEFATVEMPQQELATSSGHDDSSEGSHEDAGLLESWSLSSLGANIKRKMERSATEPQPRRRRQSRLGRLEVIYQSVEAMQATLTQYKIAGYPPDVLVRIPKDSCRFYEFYRAEELIEIGREAACRALDDYLKHSVRAG
nr:patatin-like phospholipase family protein [Motiliproteus sediminis]